MADFGEVTRYLKVDSTMTVKGKTYVLPVVGGKLGVWCRLLAQMTGELHAASTEEEIRAAIDRIDELPELPGGPDVTLAERMLGPVYHEMLADDVEDPYIQFCGHTVYISVLAGEDKAKEFYESGGNLPEARGPANRASRRAAARKTRTGAASDAQSPGSTTGTNTRQTSSSRSGANRRGRRSRGRQS